jgi:hypothetical protein
MSAYCEVRDAVVRQLGSWDITFLRVLDVI